MRYHFHFMARRRLLMTLSGIAILITIASLAFQGLNFSVDFTGGLLMDLKFSKPTTVAAITTVFDQHGLKDAEIQAVGSPSGSAAGGAKTYAEFDVRTTPVPDATRLTIYASLKKSVGDFQQVSLQEIQPEISSQLQRNALLAVIIATVGMVLYLIFRFEWKFAVAAVVALLHDIVLTVGLFSVFHLPVSEDFIAAVLTVYGYSMNDTIIVFDRIRERLGLRRKGESLSDLIDVSVNQVLNRTINTVATVLLALLAIYFIGGASIKDLVLALIVGVSFGTYSSVFIASPIYLWLCNRPKAGQTAAAKASPTTATASRPAKAES